MVSSRRPWPLYGSYIVRGASYSTVASDACPLRLPLVAQRVRYDFEKSVDNDRQNLPSRMLNQAARTAFTCRTMPWIIPNQATNRGVKT
jgi:hypothetical protein